jgi:Zn-dependent alcohol dehydrogenase
MCGKCRFCSAGRPVLCTEQGKALLTPLEGTPRTRDKAVSRSTSSRAAA